MRQNWNAGVNLSWPLFDGFRTDAQVEQAEINTRLARLRVDDLRESVALEIRQALIDLNVNREKIALEDVKREQAEEALAIAEERYQKGLQSTLEVLDAQNSLESARLNRLQAVYNCVMSRFALEKAAGISPYAE
jgi:outer membrane protein TolC